MTDQPTLFDLDEEHIPQCEDCKHCTWISDIYKGAQGCCKPSYQDCGRFEQK